MKLFHFLKVQQLRNVDDWPGQPQSSHKFKVSEDLAAQLDVWVNEGGSLGKQTT